MHFSLPCLNTKIYFLVLSMHNFNPLCANFFQHSQQLLKQFKTNNWQQSETKCFNFKTRNTTIAAKFSSICKGIQLTERENRK